MKLYRKYYITTLLLIASAVVVNAQEQLSLSKAISVGLEKNYGVIVEKKNASTSVINNHWGNTGSLPAFNFNLNQNNLWQSGDTQMESSNSVIPSVSMSLNLFNGFSARITKHRLEELQKLSEGSLNILIENTIQGIMLAYYKVLLDKENTEAARVVMELSSDRYKRAEKSYNTGTKTSYELLQSKVAMLQDRATYLNSKSTYNNSIRDLNFLMGIKDDKVYTFTDSLMMPMKDITLGAMMDKMTTNNVTLKNQYINRELAITEVRSAKSAYYPSLTMNTGYTYNYSDSKMAGVPNNVTAGYNGINLGFTLSLNLYSGGTKRRAVKIAKIKQDIAEVQLNQMEHSLKNDLSKMFETYAVRKEMVILATEQLEAAETNLKLSKRKFEAGSINSFNYRDVQIEYLNANTNKSRNRFNLIESWISLLKITGGITEATN